MMWKMTGIASYCFICRGGMNREKRLTLKKAMLLNESSQTAKTPSNQEERERFRCVCSYKFQVFS